MLGDCVDILTGITDVVSVPSAWNPPFSVRDPVIHPRVNASIGCQRPNRMRPTESMGKVTRVAEVLLHLEEITMVNFGGETVRLPCSQRDDRVDRFAETRVCLLSPDQRSSWRPCSGYDREGECQTLMLDGATVVVVCEEGWPVQEAV